MGLVCALAFKKHFASLACQVGGQSVWPVPGTGLPALEWETSYKESHFLLLMKRFKTGCSVAGFLHGEGLQEFRRHLPLPRAPGANPYPSPWVSSVSLAGTRSASGCVSFAFASGIGDF